MHNFDQGVSNQIVIAYRVQTNWVLNKIIIEHIFLANKNLSKNIFYILKIIKNKTQNNK
jgi:hypothetical protein